MTPGGKFREGCERGRCPAYLDGKPSEEQTCIFFSDGYGGSMCWVKILASLAPKEPPIFVAAIDLDEFAEKAKEYRKRQKNQPIK